MGFGLGKLRPRVVEKDFINKNHFFTPRGFLITR